MKTEEKVAITKLLKEYSDVFHKETCELMLPNHEIRTQG